MRAEATNISHHIQPLEDLLFSIPNIKRVLHCDIQPQNLLVGKNLHVKLSDFQGRCLSDTGEEVIDGYSGEPLRFFCPRDDTCDPNCKTDVFALGCTIYFIMMGHAVYPDIIDGEEGWEDEVYERFAKGQFPEDEHACAEITSKCWRQEYESVEDLVRDLAAISVTDS
ncbi:hypothetical protein QBC46DRAFT_264955 [Diplogelasinospora grovesii]|uniref:Protein kinase domain-containing protein n=1 Tax=Diplogelasinospora grovesii TaxID=303347 RepID=A0AAN6N4W8_9PEZI|nr:hypothetical protein QBC46DRAFT_264955 [Diplogelasinospora grovesii]